MRVLIVGEGKSGTTALMRSISAALGDPDEMFEPGAMTPEDLGPNPLVVKKLLLSWKQNETQLLDSFDKRILIIRDPRDRLISHLLYDAYNRAPEVSPANRDKWLRLLDRKSEKPASITLVHLLNTWWRLSGADLMSHYVRANDRINSFRRRTSGQFEVITYEDYVDGHFGDLNSYLGLDLAPGVVADDETRVARSGTYAEWRHWFTKHDVKVFRPMTDAWLNRHGYDSKDWELGRPREIRPEKSVEYVSNLFARRDGVETSG